MKHNSYNRKSWGTPDQNFQTARFRAIQSPKKGGGVVRMQKIKVTNIIHREQFRSCGLIIEE